MVVPGLINQAGALAGQHSPRALAAAAGASGSGAAPGGELSAQLARPRPRSGRRGAAPRRELERQRDERHRQRREHGDGGVDREREPAARVAGRSRPLSTRAAKSSWKVSAVQQRLPHPELVRAQSRLSQARRARARRSSSSGSSAAGVGYASPGASSSAAQLRRRCPPASCARFGTETDPGLISVECASDCVRARRRGRRPRSGRARARRPPRGSPHRARPSRREVPRTPGKGRPRSLCPARRCSPG